jgi:transcriptional regulator with XRE-family HTH domain
VFDLIKKEFCFDSDQVSHGARLWGNLLGLMLAYAWLEQRNREVMELASGERAIVATSQDYEAAYNLFKAMCERSVVNLSDTHRKILNAVYELKQETDLADGFSQRKIAEKAGVSVSTVSEHKTYLTKSVKLLREAEEGGLTLVADAEPSWWEKGDLLVGFPRPEQVREWWGEQRSTPAPEASEHAEREGDEPQEPYTSEKEGVRYSTVYRILRDTLLARTLKEMHQNQCQICGESLQLSDGAAYAEAHHVKPLGKPHNGPDIAANILVLCPNHHVLRDYGALRLHLDDLHHHPHHSIGAEFVDYHNEVILKNQ